MESDAQLVSSEFPIGNGAWQTLGRLLCAWALGEASFVDGTHACHSSAVYAVLCHGK